MVGKSPFERVDLLEQTGYIGVAHPPKVMSDISQSLETIRQVKAIGDLSDDLFIHKFISCQTAQLPCSIQIVDTQG